MEKTWGSDSICYEFTSNVLSFFSLVQSFYLRDQAGRKGIKWKALGGWGRFPFTSLCGYLADKLPNCCLFIHIFRHLFIHLFIHLFNTFLYTFYAPFYTPFCSLFATFHDCFPGLGIRSSAHRSSTHWLRSLRTNEPLWTNCSGRSCQMSHCERIAQVAHVKRATMSKLLRLLMTGSWAIRLGCSW